MPEMLENINTAEAGTRCCQAGLGEIVAAAIYPNELCTVQHPVGDDGGLTAALYDNERRPFAPFPALETAVSHRCDGYTVAGVRV